VPQRSFFCKRSASCETADVDLGLLENNGPRGARKSYVTSIARLGLFVLAISVIAPSVASGDPDVAPSTSSSAAAPVGATGGPLAARSQATVLWSEFFRGPLDWRDPQDHGSLMLARVYAVEKENGLSFLRAHHDATSKGAPPAIHFGKAFDGVPLDKVRLLRWRWRARIQPIVSDDPWEDMAASIYVVTKAPTLLRKGRGFKFGWLARPGPSRTYQRGLLQVVQRSDPPGLQWKTEEVDICGLYRQAFGPCENEQIIYIGVLTDAEGAKSTAEGDYAGFEIVAR